MLRANSPQFIWHIYHREKHLRCRAEHAGMMMKNKEDGKTQTEQALLRELDAYRRRGWTICLNGRPSAPERVLSACLREKSSYMRDFVSDDQRRIRKVDFIEISEDE